MPKNRRRALKFAKLVKVLCFGARPLLCARGVNVHSRGFRLYTSSIVSLFQQILMKLLFDLKLISIQIEKVFPWNTSQCEFKYEK